MSSPSSPTPRSRSPVSRSTTRASVAGKGIPTEPGFRRPWRGLAWVAVVVSVMPKPSVIFPPVRVSKRVMTSTGRGADPEKQARTLDMSRRSTPG